MPDTLRILRSRVKLTPASAAVRAGVSERMWRYWEEGKSEIPSGRLVTVARLLSNSRRRVTVDQVLQAWAESAARDVTEVSEWPST